MGRARALWLGLHAEVSGSRPVPTNPRRGSVRYKYAHSILPYTHEDSQWDGQTLQSGHRISLMVRVGSVAPQPW